MLTHLYHRTVTAYHGCDRTLAEAVLLGKDTLIYSKNDYDWLGHGIYFWEHGPRRAYEWAKFRSANSAKRDKIKDPGVIGAHINLGVCFDLLDTQYTALLGEMYPLFVEAFATKAAPLPVNKGLNPTDDDLIMRFLDCAVINWSLDLLKEKGHTNYQTVRGAFAEGQPAFDGSKLMHKSHIQIAVRDPNCILGYFRPNLDFSAQTAVS